MNSRHGTYARNGFCGLYALSEVSTITFESQCIRWNGPGASLWWIIKQMHYAAWKGCKQVKLSWIIDNHFFNSSLEVSLLFVVLPLLYWIHSPSFVISPKWIISIQEKCHTFLCTAYNILQCCTKWVWSVHFDLSGLSACWICMVWNVSFCWKHFSLVIKTGNL